MRRDGFSVALAHWPRDRDTLAAIREQVFVREQGVPLALEWDGHDAQATHLLARSSGGDAIGNGGASGGGSCR